MNNAYIICNDNNFNYVIVSNMYFVVNQVDPTKIESVIFNELENKINIDNKVFIDIEAEHSDVLKNIISENNVSLSILSVKGEIIAMHKIH